jgi:hypothetical protein
MAYVSSLQDEEDRQSQQQQGSTLSPSLSEGAGSSTKLAGSNASQVSNPQAPEQQKLPQNNFADLNNYLRINGGDQFGQQFTGKLQGDIDQASNQLGQSANQFKQRADQAKVTDSNNLIGQVDTNPQGIDATAYQNLTNAKYSGPQSFQDASDLYQQAQGGTQKAQNNAQASGTESGRFALLDNYFGRPNYGQGGKALDNLLLQNDANTQQSLNQIQQNAKNLGQQFNQTSQDLGRYGDAAQAATTNTRNQARSALGIDDSGNLTGQGAIGNLQKQVTDQYNTALQNQQSEIPQIQAALSSHDISNLSPDVQKALGLQGVQYLYGVDPNQFLTTNNISQLGETSQDQVNRMNALYNLADLSSTSPYSNVDASQVGTNLNAPDFSYNLSGLTNAIDTAKNNSDAGLRNELNQTTTAQADPATGRLVQMPIDQAVTLQGPRIQPAYDALKSMGFSDFSPAGLQKMAAAGGDREAYANQIINYNNLLNRYNAIVQKYKPTDMLKQSNPVTAPTYRIGGPQR